MRILSRCTVLTVTFVCLGFSLLLPIGCGTSGPYPVAVKGSVTLDGKPLDDGRISFITLGQVPEMLDVKNGQFHGKVNWGQRRVEIAAYRPYQIPPDIPASMHELMKNGKENYLTEKYHTHSELTAEVKQRGANEFSFTLLSQ